MLLQRRRWVGATLLVLLSVILAGNALSAFCQQTPITRNVKTKVPPIYPEIARRLGLGGTVKLLVVVAPNGSVKSSKVLGGHPVLAVAAQDALKSWKFEAGPEESSGVVEFTFKPQD